MGNQKTFRSALNGFNREDVVHYIEYINAQHAAQINQLNAEAEHLRSQLAEAAAVPAGDPALETELAQLQAQLEDKTQAEAVLQEQLQAALAEKDQLEEQLREALNAKYQAETQRDAALASQTVAQNRAAEELEAYRRAERAERVANERAERVYHRVNGVLADATVKVDEAASAIGDLSDQVLAQLTQLQNAVSGSKDALQNAVETMYALRPAEE